MVYGLLKEDGQELMHNLFFLSKCLYCMCLCGNDRKNDRKRDMQEKDKKLFYYIILIISRVE